MTRETIVYGGAFNPPTIAHEMILQACIDYACDNDDEVWLLPSGNRYDKAITTPVDKRLQYMQAMRRDVDGRGLKIRILTTELYCQVPVETTHTVAELRVLYPDRLFRFVFGTDSVQTMPGWRDGPDMLKTLPMLIVPRPGYQIDFLPDQAVWLRVITPKISSTMVRHCQEFRPYVGANVAGLIDEN